MVGGREDSTSREGGEMGGGGGGGERAVDFLVGSESTVSLKVEIWQAVL